MLIFGHRQLNQVVPDMRPHSASIRMCLRRSWCALCENTIWRFSITQCWDLPAARPIAPTRDISCYNAPINQSPTQEWKCVGATSHWIPPLGGGTHKFYRSTCAQLRPPRQSLCNDEDSAPTMPTPNRTRNPPQTGNVSLTKEGLPRCRARSFTVKI